MPDEKISQMPSAGTLNGTDIFPIVRNGQNYSGTAAALAALASLGSTIFPAPVDTRSTPQSYTLPVGALAEPIIIVFDQFGNAQTNPITIHGSGAGTPVINMIFGSIPFFWTGSVWFPF
jgi:hypothetical protein